MAGGGEVLGARELDQTPTWAVAVVVAVIIIISILLETILHHVGHYFQHKKKYALKEALEKVKGELMVLGFISLILTFGQGYIARICIPEDIADTMLYCPKKHQRRIFHHHKPDEEQQQQPAEEETTTEGRRRLLSFDDYEYDVRRFLAGGGAAEGCKQGKVPLISMNGLHQLHIFIFFLAVFHVAYSATTMMLGRLKTRGWKEWERECLNQVNKLNDPSRVRLTHETSFVRDHTRGAWTKTTFSFYFVCLWRQFFRSVRKADYLTMRHGFVSVHLSPGSKFDFQKYIKKSLEDDFKVVVGITPFLWASVVTFLLMDVNGWHVMNVVSMTPLVLTLAVGTKLQAIISQMALEIVEKHAVIQGMPLVHVSDSHFWFGKPQWVLHMLHFVLFQNAFEVTYFFWIWYEFGLMSCFHQDFILITIRVCLGVVVQFICSYVTLPLYALVTQMGSTMKRSIFDEQTSTALKHWQRKATHKKGDHSVGRSTRDHSIRSNKSADDSGSVKGRSPSVDLSQQSAPAAAEAPPPNQTPKNSNVDLLTGP